MSQPGSRVTLQGTVRQRQNTSTGVRLLISHYRFTEIEAFSEHAASLKEKEKERYFKDSGSWEIAVFVSDSFNPAKDSLGAEGARIGQRVEITGICSLPDVPTCPGQFDSRSYWRARKVLLEVSKPERIADAGGIRGGLPGRITSFIAESLSGGMENVFDERDAGFVSAMTLGDRSGLIQEDRRLLQEGGIFHILSISAMHLSVLCAGFYRFLRRRGAPYPIAALTASLFALSYCLMTGMGISARRALILFLFRMGAETAGRRTDKITALAVAAAIIVMDCPYVLTDCSFLLSFACAASIEFVAPLFKKRKVPESLAFSAAVFAGALPLMMYFFYQITPWSILLCMIVLPAMEILIPCALLAGILGVFSPAAAVLPGAFCRLMLFLCRQLCRLFSYLPGAVLVTGKPAAFKILLYYAVLALVLALAAGGKKWKAPAALYLGALILLFFRKDPGLRLTFLDVGQGESIIVEAQGEAFLIDAGSSQITGVWANRIEPALKSMGIRRLSAVFVSHGDSDHTNGLMEYLEGAGRGAFGRDRSGITAEGIIVSARAAQDEGLTELATLAAQKKIPVRMMDRGMRLPAGEGSFTCLWPSADGPIGDVNENSLVLLGSFPGLSVLFTGDLEKEAEERLGEAVLAGEPGMPSSVDILKVGHHGSAFATSEKFLEAVSPKAAVISCGKNNVYGHPSGEVLKRLQDAGCRVLRTDLDGSVIIQIRK